ncbi:hypothetical protein ANAPC1_00358 [Anaplasma phagocytophilum]|uniref:Uncharacterized protein n=3 Tax=Anaplasma phagocytophilum TaxID=948 RepID=A0AA45USI3_ANAPH|nr:hypothetical protein APHNP_1764 [Anaplasma phagocytophilum str. ApNP]SBO14016.1 hypothetical protein ANAPC1_00358 [Anaplasma phagocytophilum]SCV63595.1 hypothetical protein ANAPH2_00683 [Anaplasma phagocytophilum]
MILPADTDKESGVFMPLYAVYSQGHELFHYLSLQDRQKLQRIVFEDGSFRSKCNKLRVVLGVCISAVEERAIIYWEGY